MKDILQTSKLFFEACDSGKGWQGCKQYCHQDGTFTCQNQALQPIKTLKDYTGFMVAIFKMMPDAHYELLHYAQDSERKTVAVSAIFKGTHTGEPGPGGVNATGKATNSHYTYLMQFEGDKIKSMIKIWNHAWAFKELGWA